MAFTFIGFRASPSSVVVTSSCSERPCGSGGAVDLIPDLEISGHPRFDVKYAIGSRNAGFCRNGSAVISKSDVPAASASETVRFCREGRMSPGYDSITVRATIAERGGLSQARETVVTVRPTDMGRLRAHAASTREEAPEAVHVSLDLPTSVQTVPGVVRLSVAQESDVWFDDGGRRTKILRVPVMLGAERQRLDKQVRMRLGRGHSSGEDVWITASVHAGEGGYLGQRRARARFSTLPGK